MYDAESVQPELLSINNIEALTGISQRTLWRWVSSGQFPKPDLSVGRIRRWKTQTIHTWINEQSESR